MVDLLCDYAFIQKLLGIYMDKVVCVCVCAHTRAHAPQQKSPSYISHFKSHLSNYLIKVSS